MHTIEEIIFQLISFSGTARSCVYEAFEKCKNEDYEGADESIQEAKEQLLLSHNIQTELIQNEANGNSVEVKLLMVHAQDHLMTTILAKELIEKMMNMQKEINHLKAKKID